ncbi:G patch domain-containing protein 8 [Mortierella alpina]|nr:G patch domain-containing protein 8 [Mortierella alpina]
MQQPSQQQQRMERFYRQELEELANTRDALRAKYRPGSQSGSDDDSLSERDFGVDGYDSGPEVEAADMQTHIPESNMGYRLLVKMGWKAGTGLGQNATGRKAPIEIERKQDVLGIGKQAVDIWYAEASTAKRKTLEAERQAEETAEEKAKRELQVQQQQAVSAELEMVKSAFYCALCDKQYERISDYEVHLSSYDHNHKKRFKDMKDTSRAGSASTTSKIKEKERRREEKELAKMQQAALKRAGGRAPTGEPAQTSSSAQPLETGGIQPGTPSGFQPVQESGFQPVKLGGFQPIKSTGKVQPAKLGGFQSVDDEDVDLAPAPAETADPSKNTVGASPSGFQPVKLGGFKPMKFGAFQLKKPGAK